jgi:preprotein translocase subunit SecA
MFNFLKGLFDSNEKQLKAMQPIIDEVNSLEGYTEGLSDEELTAKTTEFRKKLGVDIDNPRDSELDLEKAHEQLMEFLPEAFAVVREVAKRRTNHRHFDVQVMAGYVLATNKIAELFTGEGKTNAANLPLYLYALTGKGAHLVTVNDYLARRDGEWNGHILSALGLQVGVVNNGTQFKFISDEEAIKLKGDDAKKAIEEREKKAKEVGRLKLDLMEGVNLVEVSKQEVYACDVIYGTNNEFGFDYLRDNMSRNKADVVQGPLHYAIVDEADSILIDEARTPLIISQSATAANDMYKQFASIVRQLEVETHYAVDEKSSAVSLSDAGVDRVEEILNIDNAYEDGMIAYHLDNALKAKELYKRDDKYIIRDGQVMIVDDFTGRVMEGRRYSEGLHQAIEAKEGVEVQRESRTLATITLQNYFRLYDFLAGMTATALTEAEELASIYELDVVVVPTNRPVVRKDHNDVVYRTQDAKFRAIVEDVKEHHEIGQPVLVGTASVEHSEQLSDLLMKEGIPHDVLNAKQHEREANIVQSAGQKGAVTIATNMAGRGTDIALGEGVKEMGGLYVIGSERHESRRIDNQLRGRSGRQGDPGKSMFYVSFEDDLMRIFGGDRMKLIMEQVGLDDDIPISMGILGATIENAQKRVEAHNYDIRKRLVEYDDVLNQQRDIIYAMRSKILELIDQDNPEEVGELNKKALLDIPYAQLLEELDAFTLSNSDSWDINALDEFPVVSRPINVWILKRYVGHVRFLVSSQLRDDMDIDTKEEYEIVTQMQNLLTDEVVESATSALGYKTSTDFFKEFDALDNPVEQEMTLIKLLVTGFILRVDELGEEAISQLSKLLVLQTVDNYWMEHLDAMASLRDGISMRSLAQKDPLVEYKNEGYRLFESMLSSVDEAVVNRFFKVKVVRQQAPVQAEVQHEKADASVDNRPGSVSKQTTKKRTVPKVGRNEPCPCGSGKKYKKCHGA